MSLFHSHCKECDKSIPLGWDYCSISCEQAERREYMKLVNDSIELNSLKDKTIKSKREDNNGKS